VAGILREGLPDLRIWTGGPSLKMSIVQAAARVSAYHFLTPVWGKAYTKTYLELVMPAQLSIGNLGAFAGDSWSRYVIYTTRADAETIKAAPAFQKLSAIIPAVIEIIDHEIVVPHDSMSICFRKGITGALAADAAVVFLTPDLIFADGSFAALKRLCESGRDVVFNPGIRTIKQGVTRALLSKYEADGVITVGPRDLMRVALDNIHPLSNSSWWEEGEGDLIPANLYWRVGSQGILSHCFHLHPLLVRAQRKNPIFFGTVDDDFVVAACPDASRDHVVEDSDEILMIEVSDAARFFMTGFRKGSIEDVSDWAEQFANERHRALFPIPVKMHAGVTDPAAWREAERRATPVVAKVRERMARPFWRLISSKGSGFTRRLWRVSQEQELARANGFPIEGSPMDVACVRAIRLLARSAAKGAELTRRVARSSAALKESIMGRADEPAIWSTQYLVRRARARDLKEATATTEQALIICANPRSSVAHAAIAAAPMGVLVAEDDKQSLLLQATSALAPDGAYDTIILDGILPAPRQGEAWFRELARVLRPGGRLIVIAHRFFDVDTPWRSESCTSIGNVETMIRPEFSPIASRVHGAAGSFILESATVWGQLLFLRSRPLRFIAIFLRLALLPISLASALLANILAFVLNRIDRSGQFYVSSMVVAIRAKPGAPE
jgi:hypothetical protein